MKMEWQNVVLTYGFFTPPSLFFAMRLLQQIKLFKACIWGKPKELAIEDEVVEDKSEETVEDEEIRPIYTNEQEQIQIYRIMKRLNREDEFIDILGINSSPDTKISNVDTSSLELAPLGRKISSPRFTLPHVPSKNITLSWYKPYHSLLESRNRLRSRGHVRGPRRIASVIETLQRFVN